MSISTRTLKSSHLSIGRGGWSLEFPKVRESHGSSKSKLSHYGNSWREHLHELAADCIGTDVCDMPELVLFAVSGPMSDCDVPAGCVAHVFAEPEPFRDDPAEGRDPRFGNTGSLSTVATDVYVELVRRFDGRVFDPWAECAELIDAARAWALDCQWLDADSLDEYTPAQIAEGVERHYEGGWRQFVRDFDV